MSPRLGDHSMAPNMLRHISAVCFLMGSVLLPRNMLQVSECAGRYTALTQEVRSSGQAWRSHILETRQFLLDRGLKTHSLLMPFLPRQNVSFPAFCVLRVTDCLKRLAWRSFFRTNFPSWLTRGKAPTLTGKGKPTSKHLFHQVFSVGMIQRM